MTYKDLFGNYLRTVKEICITAPFIRQPYQIDNLVDFIQIVKDVSPLQDTPSNPQLIGLSAFFACKARNNHLVAHVLVQQKRLRHKNPLPYKAT